MVSPNAQFIAIGDVEFHEARPAHVHEMDYGSTEDGKALRINELEDQRYGANVLEYGKHANDEVRRIGRKVTKLEPTLLESLFENFSVRAGPIFRVRRGFWIEDLSHILGGKRMLLIPEDNEPLLQTVQIVPPPKLALANKRKLLKIGTKVEWHASTRASGVVVARSESSLHQ